MNPAILLVAGGEDEIEQAIVVEVGRLSAVAHVVKAAQHRRLRFQRIISAVHEQEGPGVEIGGFVPVLDNEVNPTVVVGVAEDRVGEIRSPVGGVNGRAGTRFRRRGILELAPVAKPRFNADNPTD